MQVEKEGIKIIIGGDFNTRIGEERGWRKRESEEG